MSHSWLFLGCHTHRHMSPLLTEELPDITEGCQGALPSGERTQSEPSTVPLTLPQAGEGTALRLLPFQTSARDSHLLCPWLPGFLNATFLGCLIRTPCHSAMFVTPKCHAWSMTTRVSAFCELVNLCLVYSFNVVFCLRDVHTTCVPGALRG